MKYFRNRYRNRAQALVEYALVLASVGIVLITSLTFLGTSITGTYTTVNTHLSKNIR